MFRETAAPLCGPGLDHVGSLVVNHRIGRLESGRSERGGGLRSSEVHFHRLLRSLISLPASETWTRRRPRKVNFSTLSP